jgi:Ca2+-transporting ATPase/DNA polymerase kappa
MQVTQIEKVDESTNCKASASSSKPDQLTNCKASASSSKPDQHFWLDGYICSLCGFELPPCFEEERQEHSDFHLAEMLQKEDAADSQGHLSKERYFSAATCSVYLLLPIAFMLLPPQYL